MKANELMIGDWVLQDGFEYKVVMLRECDILNEYPIAVDSIVHGYTYCPSDAIQPIPLTAEILEKNGFRLHSQCGYEYVEKINDSFSFRFSVGGLFKRQFNVNINGKLVTLNYVHELQHALRLCKLNDLADNFKV